MAKVRQLLFQTEASLWFFARGKPFTVSELHARNARLEFFFVSSFSYSKFVPRNSLLPFLAATQFPLLNSQCDDVDGSLECGVCGTKFSFSTGKMTGINKKEGLAGVFGNVMSSSPGGNLAAYEVKAAPNGKVYAAMGLKPQ